MQHLFRLSALAVLLTVLCVAAMSAPRKILVEIQTSTTCAPCYPADVFYFMNWLPNYGGASSIVTLAYHVWWPTPGDDPIYLANTSPVQTRISYYAGGGSTFAPRAYIDGFIDGGSSYSTWPGAVEGRFLDPSPITITLTGNRNGNTLTMNAAIFAEQPVNSSNWRVHWALVESGVSAPQNTGSGYIPFIHDHAHRNMYPDGNGSTITISQGQTVNIPRTITLNPAWVANNCRVIVFVQNNTDKKVQNVEYVEVADLLTDVEESPGAIPETFSLSQNYPNPFNPETVLEFHNPQSAFVSLKVYNLLGQEVRTLVSVVMPAGRHEVRWDGTSTGGVDVPSGTYIYRMVAGGFQQTRKMLLLR